MSFLYDRIETKDKVKISFKNTYLWYLNLLALIGISFIQPSSELIAIVVIVGILLLVSAFLYQFIIRMKLATEIRKAMKKGTVEVSGNKFSNKHPLTYTLKK